jgi:hypothetical protein
MRPLTYLVVGACLFGIVVPDAARAEDTDPLYDPVLTSEAPPALWSSPDLDIVTASYTPPPEAPPPAALVEPPAAEPTAAPPESVDVSDRSGGTVRDRALTQLQWLGAAQWQISVFDCIARNESRWQNKRSDRMNYNGTWDHGVWQINDIHWPLLNALGLDPYIPEDAARFVWRLSRSGSSFQPWSVRASCGV